MKTKPAEELSPGEDILLCIHGQMCDLTVLELNDRYDNPTVELVAKPRFLPGAADQYLYVPRKHSVRILEAGE